MGQSNINNYFTPTLLVSNININQISAGETHTLILSKQGVVYTFGSNNVFIYIIKIIVWAIGNK